MSRASPYDLPATVILDALGRTGPDAYTPDVRVPDGRWHARCPVCGGHRTLLVSESRRAGPVTLRCSSRCHELRVLAVLERRMVEAEIERERLMAMFDALLPRIIQAAADERAATQRREAA